MIVSSYFNGDDDTETALLQHDVYHQALGIVISECRQFYILAHALTDTHLNFTKYDDIQIDHRTLQAAHDILAAVWRYRTNSVQLYLPFFERGGNSSQSFNMKPMNRWLAWLKNEVQSWKNEPYLIRYIWSIVENQDSDLLDKAKELTTKALYERFRDVPWLKNANVQ